MKISVALWCFSLLSTLSMTSALNVLALLPFNSYSHFSIGLGMIKAISEAGHKVTSIAPYSIKEKLNNYTEILTDDFIEFMDKKTENINPFYFESDLKIIPLVELLAFHYGGGDLIDFYMNHPKIKKLLQSNEKFDICLIETLFFDSLNYGISEHFGCKIVTFVNLAGSKYVDDMTGNISPPSYVPKLYLSYTDNMSFSQRLLNTFYTFIEDFVHEYFIKMLQRRYYRKYFPNAKRSFDEMHESVSIIFMNTHISTSTTPRSYMPNVVEIGGIHLPKNKKLPQDIQNFIESANDGVILFSMGAALKASQWPAEKCEAFLKAFGKLKQKVIWNNDIKSLPNMPKNVMIKAHLPEYQYTIFSHKNAKLFIGHGGLVGITDALSTGIPILILPIFNHDQKLNKAQILERGNGLHIKYSNITEESLTATINELINNPKYRENAKIIANRFNDRPMTPQESVVYWIEYAARHQGGHHLKSKPALEMNYFALRSWDSYLTIDLILLILTIIQFYLLRGIYRRCRKSPENKKKKTN